MKRSIKSKTRSAEKSRKAKLPSKLMFDTCPVIPPLELITDPEVSSDLAATPAREQGDPPTAGFVMDRDLFKTIVEDFIVHEMQNPDLTYDTMAVEALQKATEDYMTIVFQSKTPVIIQRMKSKAFSVV